MHLQDRRLFVDDWSLNRELLRMRHGNPFAALYPNSCPFRLIPYSTLGYLRLAYALSGDRTCHSFAAPRKRDGRLFVDDPDARDWHEEMGQEYECWERGLIEAQGAEACWQDTGYEH